MSRNSVTIIIFLICAAGIALFAFLSQGTNRPFLINWLFSEKKVQEQHRTRIIVPGIPDGSGSDLASLEYMVYEDLYNLKAPLNDGELVISVLNMDFNNDSIEEQMVVFRSLGNPENPVAFAFFAYNEDEEYYQRMWETPIAATMPETVSLYTQDLLGDRSVCIVVTGMNLQGEHTMTIFRQNHDEKQDQPFVKIADITMDGSIAVRETERSLAYRQGIVRGQPFAIIAHRRDTDSPNILDRVEITYTYNDVRGIYEQSALNRVPGSQIEQRRLREILSGGSRVFEDFINDLWYHVSPQGTIDKSQYLYFDPAKREIIFFGDDTQQIFIWQHSTSTRYGLYVSSQNISITTLRRFLDIEMESLDSIRIRVFEDVRLKIGVSASWDGSYRRAGIAVHGEDKTNRPYTDAVYDSSMGRLHFASNGEYELSSGGSVTRGRYAFFRMGGQELLELRPERGTAGGAYGSVQGESGEGRLIYSLSAAEGDGLSGTGNLMLARVRLGASGVQELHEGHIILTQSP
jgi:hypothetical protein